MRRLDGHRRAFIVLFSALACTVAGTRAQAQTPAPPASPDPAAPAVPAPTTLPAPTAPEPAAASPTPVEPAPLETPPAAATAVPPPAEPAPAAPAAVTTAEAPSHSCEDCMHSHQRRSEDYMLGAFVGGAFFDLSDLNDRLAAEGYERLDGPMVVIGGEGRAIGESGFVFGAHGAGIVGATGEGPGSLETDWSGGYAMADLGYAPIRLESFLLLVTAGIGGYGLTLEIADNRAADFDDILESPRRSSTLTRGGVIFGLSLRLDARIPIGPVRDTHQGYLALGLRVSGLLGPALDHWSLPDDDDAKGGPTSGLTGVYAAFVLGWGGRAVTSAR